MKCLCGCNQETSGKPGVLFRAGHANIWRKTNKKKIILKPVKCACGTCGKMTSGYPGIKYIKGHNRIKPDSKHRLKPCACGCSGMTRYTYVRNHDPYHNRGRTVKPKEIKIIKKRSKVKGDVEKVSKGIQRYRDLISRNKRSESSVELRVSAGILIDNFDKYMEEEEIYDGEKRW